MPKPERNSAAACLWLLMLTLDADGKRKDVEFSEIQVCLKDLFPQLDDEAGCAPEALMASLNRYYSEVENAGEESVINIALDQIDDLELRQKMFVMLMRVAISDKQLHRREDTLLRRIGLAWGLKFQS